MVTFKENQAALRLIHDNFPKSLLWEYNAPHMKETKPTYIQNLTTKSTIRKSVRFSLQSSTICLKHMVKIESDYIKKYGEFSSFPHFIKKNKIFKTSFIRTKTTDGQISLINIFFTLQSCPATSSREISILYKWYLTDWCKWNFEDHIIWMAEWYIQTILNLFIFYSQPQLTSEIWNKYFNELYIDTFCGRPGAPVAKYTWDRLILLQYLRVWGRLPL